ncbi:MAG: bi-domain-containing oxidoreductase [bacterium]
MKQIIQNYKSGKLNVEQVPDPALKPGHLLLQTRCSLISTGTERNKIITASKNIIAKAKARPDQVKLVINNLKQEGLIATIKKALIKLDTPISLGYSCCGDIIKINEEIKNFEVGDRIACMGEGFATHAEINSVPSNLCVKMPNNVSYKQACFVGLGAIAMQGVRNASVNKNDKICVIGLGLIGQLTTQILKAFGCEVIGVDLDKNKLSLAKEWGIHVGNPVKDDIESLARDFTQNKGMDAVIITAASKDSVPIELAGKIAKKYGHVVLVGLVPIQIPRKDFFDKELTFIVSRGFGDESSLKGKTLNNRKIWSAKENAEEFLSLMSQGLINVDKLISQEFSLRDAKKAYELLSSKRNDTLGIIINYAEKTKPEQKVEIPKKAVIKKDVVNVGFIGAGSFSLGYLLPIFAKNKNVNLRGVSTTSGISSKNIANKFGFSYATSESKDIIHDSSIDCIVITTRHNLHASFIIEGLRKNKIVFVEKPLCISEKELQKIITAQKETNGKIMIGFNRRFSPFVIKLNGLFKNRISPLMINYRINGGYLDDSHWLNDLSEGGGRIIGEVCHFIDLLQFITESSPLRIFAEAIDSGQGQKSQSLIITIKFKDGSLGTINYNAVGDTSYPRERIEVFGQDSTAVIDNFRKAEFAKKNKINTMSRLGRDMGYNNEINKFIDCVLNKKKMPINFEDIVYATYSTFKIVDSLKEGIPVKIDLTDLGL